MSTLQPFPKLSKSLRDKFNISDLALRFFGSNIKDLEINFTVQSLPMLVTQLIRSCTVVNNDQIIDESFFWNLNIGQRIECLVKIAMSDNSPYLVTVINCQEEECKERFQLTLSYHDIFSQALQSSFEDKYTVTVVNKDVQVRRPTGVDQQSWQKLDFSDEKQVLRNIIMSLICDNFLLYGMELTSEVIQKLGNKMSEIDPLIDYKMELECPYCRIKHFYEVNLEKLALRRLNKIQKELLKTIHEIAHNYHWTESEILAIPAARRNLYLSIIETGNT